MNIRLLYSLVTLAALTLLIGSVSADELVTTTVKFNIPTEIGFSVTLPGQSAVNSATGGAATADIEFNLTATNAGGTQADVEACVVAGSCQVISSTTSIFTYDNIGTVNINISLAFNTTLPSCVAVAGATTATCAGTNIAATNVTVLTNYAPATAAQKYYLCADFTACTASDSTSRLLRHHGGQFNQ